MDEKKERNLRRRAIRLILQGVKPSAIAQRIGRSRTWLFKWKTRFDQLGWEGLKSQLRRPHRIARRYDERTRRLVIQARRRLVRRKVGLIGPRAIQDELRAAQLLRHPPSRSTIKRMLHASGLITAPRAPRPVYYPRPTPARDYVLHACDWTARFLRGGCKVFAFHTLDLGTYALHQTIGADKSLAAVGQHALETWHVLGLPDGLQLDNDAAFCGGSKAPRRFGQFVRLCL
jgi:putative transposase